MEVNLQKIAKNVIEDLDTNPQYQKVKNSEEFLLTVIYSTIKNTLSEIGEVHIK